MEIKNPIEDDGEDDGLKEVNVSKIEDKTSDDSFENNRGFKEENLGFPELDNIPEPAPIKKISNDNTIFSDENLEDQKESEGSDDVESLF